MNNLKLDNQEFNNKGYHPLFIAILILSIHGLIVYKFHDFILHQITLRDFDGYWHLARVKDLHNFGNTYHTIQSRSNAPYGESLHWTSAFDLLLYSSAYIGSFFVDFNTALLWCSIIINPLLHVLSFVVLYWCFRDFIGDLRASIFGVIFAFQPSLNGIFDMGVPDHHGSQILLFSIFIALVVKSIISGSWKYFLLCGIVGGLSIWLGIESISVVLLVFFFFGIIWILEGIDDQSKILLFSLILFLTTFLTTILDEGYDELMKVVYDRLSIVHVFLFLTITCFWALVVFVSKWSDVFERRIGRIIAASIGVVTCVILMHELFPLFFKNPLSEVNPLIKKIYLNQTNEFSGLFSGGNTQSINAYIYWAMTLPAVPIGIVLARHNQAKKRKAWILITLVTIVYIILSAWMSRMITYATLCALITISYAISHVYVLINNHLGRSYYSIARTLFIMACCFSFSVPILIFKTNQSDYLINDNKFLLQICDYLNDDPFFKNNPKRILTSMYLGPLLLYKTPHEVIGTPSHRNVSGILDTYYVMNAKTEEDAHAIIRRRGIQVLLIGKPEYGIGDYFINVKNNRPESGNIFHHQLWKGVNPAWVQLYPVPKYLDGKIKVFKVIE